jgi:glycosyltransferase involved in cell wall biosynthesis
VSPTVILRAFNVGVLGYFLVLNTATVVLVSIAAVHIRHRARRTAFVGYDDIFANPLTPPISIVVPAHNEGEVIQDTVEAMLALRYSEFEVIVVDDGSTDATRARLRELATALPALRVVQLRANFGQTAALAAGFDLARGAFVITLDGDGQNDPVDIPRLVDKLKEGYDVVSGWRHDRQDPFLSRRLPSQVANALISWITGVRLHDYGCALKVYRREILQDVALYGEMHRFLPALCRWVGATIGELPVSHWPRRKGVSKYGLGRLVRVLLDLLTVKFLMSYWTRPIQIFGLLGLMLGGLGIGVGAVLSYQKIFHGMGLGNRPLLLLAVLLVLVGFQFVSIGLLGEMLVRTYHESQRKPVYTIRDIFSGGQ